MRIGLTYTGSPEKHQFYVDWLSEGKEVEVILLSAEQGNRHELQHCQALVLSGGRDIHPSFYGSTRTDYPGAPADFDEARDSFEMDIFQEALEKKIPVLGICRGMQLINIACKGTLVQDLGNKDLESIHRGNPDKMHHVLVNQPSLLFDIAGKPDGRINSAHHQAVQKAGEGLVANAVSDEGIIEGLEWKNKSNKAFLLGVQWHPERMFRFGLQNTPLSKNIRERFLIEINKNNS